MQLQTHISHIEVAGYEYELTIRYTVSKYRAATQTEPEEPREVEIYDCRFNGENFPLMDELKAEIEDEIMESLS